MDGYLAITGGVGGAKLGLGLAKILGPEQLSFAVNTGDDFEHFGLQICPDVDTLTYTLAEISNQDVGWGRADESWAFMDALAALKGETWFKLGDRDLALHVRRTALLQAGWTLTAVTREISTRLGVAHPILPMSDDPVRTTVRTPAGPLSFQHYFVRDRCRPTVTGFDFVGSDQATLNPAIVKTLGRLRGIIICPSNPFVSIDPLLSLPGARQMLGDCGVPIVAVSPIVGGQAIKGPTAKMMQELEIPVTARQVAEHYGDLLSGFVLDERDADLDGTLDVPTVVTQSIMVTLQDRIALASSVVEFIDHLS